MSQPSSRPAQALVLTGLDRTSGDGRGLDPLYPVLGVPLLARTLFSLQQAGVGEATVLLEAPADAVRDAMARRPELHLTVRWLETDEDDGRSLGAAREALSDPFVCVPNDCIFEPAVVRRLREGTMVPNGVAVAADFTGPAGEASALNGVTRLQVPDGRVTDIGSSLSHSDAVFTGLSWVTPHLFLAIDEAPSGSASPFLDGVRILAQRGLVTATDVSGLMWRPVHAQDPAPTERALMAAARKPTDGPISRYLNRPVSLAISRRLARTRVTPNGVTAFNLVVGLLTGFVAAIGGYTAFLVAALLFHLTSILDGVDGELAKFTQRASRRGEWFDTITDNVTYVAFLLGLVWGVARSAPGSFYHFWGVMGLIMAVATFVNFYFYLALQKRSGSVLSVRFGYEDGTGWIKRVLRRLHYLGKRDMMAFLVMLLGIVGQLPWALVLFGVAATFLIFPASVIANVTLVRQMRRERRDIPDSVGG